MQTNHRLVARARTTAALTATLTLGALVGAGSAAAHVHVDSDNAVRGDDAIVTFQVPNESEKGSATTQVTIDLPNVAALSTEVIPGWTAKLDRDPANGAYRSVTFTAAPNAGIGPDQFGRFPISIQLPNSDSVSFPVVQTYADGTTVRWDQPTPPGGAEPDYPAPVLELHSGPPQPPEHHAAPTAPASPATAPTVTGSPVAEAPPPPATADTTARLLAGGALLVAAAGVAVALVRRRT